MDYYAHARVTRVVIEPIAEEQSTTLACMHGSAWRGDGRALLRALADRRVIHALGRIATIVNRAVEAGVLKFTFTRQREV